MTGVSSLLFLLLFIIVPVYRSVDLPSCRPTDAHHTYSSIFIIHVHFTPISPDLIFTYIFLSLGTTNSQSFLRTD